LGSRMSLTTTPRKSRPSLRRACSALPAHSVAMPSSCRACSQPSATSGSSSMISTFNGSVMLCRLRAQGEFQREDGAAVRMVGTGERAAEVADDVGRDGQAETEADTDRLGREKGFEEV